MYDMTMGNYKSTCSTGCAAWSTAGTCAGGSEAAVLSDSSSFIHRSPFSLLLLLHLLRRKQLRRVEHMGMVCSAALFTRHSNKLVRDRYLRVFLEKHAISFLKPAFLHLSSFLPSHPSTHHLSTLPSPFLPNTTPSTPSTHTPPFLHLLLPPPLLPSLFLLFLVACLSQARSLEHQLKTRSTAFSSGMPPLPQRSVTTLPLTPTESPHETNLDMGIWCSDYL